MGLIVASVPLLAVKQQTYFVCSKTFVISLQSPLCIFKGLKRQLLLPAGVCVGQEGQIPRRPGQPPQELCILAAWKHTTCVTTHPPH